MDSRPAVVTVALAVSFLVSGCQRGGDASPVASSPPPSSAAGSGVLPPGMCACACPSAASSASLPPPSSSFPPAPGDLGELSASASRKMMHGDGAGCLADLDALARIDQGLEARLAMVRGQCEMLDGKCQQGKQRISSYYMTESGFSKELADRTTEALIGMRCRGGDATARDELLRAFFELTDGAYMNGKTAAECKKSLDTAKRLIPDVPARDFDDQQIKGGAQALFFTGAQCFAKAGDCAGAWEAYRGNYPVQSLSAIADPKQREKVVRDAFDSSIERCKAAK